MERFIDSLQRSSQIKIRSIGILDFDKVCHSQRNERSDNNTYLNPVTFNTESPEFQNRSLKLVDVSLTYQFLLLALLLCVSRWRRTMEE
mmetsp:Transcript_24748/g.27067  ORF Transcript_24748/g.27067 Transcript_24748/m.27067 type:complete len:89 (-) Transcript_24748:856-1122(-)